MSELRLYLRASSSADGTNDFALDACWVVRAPDGLISASGESLDTLPAARACHLVLPANKVAPIPARLPALPAARIPSLLPAAAEAISLDAAEALLVTRFEQDAQGISWLAVIDKAWLRQVLACLTRRGIHVRAALPESLLLPHVPQEWSLCLQDGGVFARLGKGIGLALDSASRTTPPKMLQLALAAPPGGKKPHCLRVYPNYQSCPPDDVLDVEQWQAALDLPVVLMPDWHWSTAQWPDDLNLLQGEFRPRKLDPDWWRPVVRGLGLGLLTLGGVHFLGTAIDTVLLAREQDRLQATLNRLAAQALPAHAAIVDPAWQIAGQLAVLQAATGRADNDALALLSRVGALTPPGGGAPRQLEYAPGRLVLHFANASSAWSDAFVTALGSAGFAATAEPVAEAGLRLVITIPGARHEK